MLLVGLVPGCAQEAESLYAEKHIVPAHWPVSIADAATKLAERMDQLPLDSTGSDAERASLQNEIIDLIEWAPEVVADTDASEEQWVPIFDQCERLRKELRRGSSLISQKAAVDALIASLQSLSVQQIQ